MKIRTSNQFVDLLDSELAWRKKELTFLRGNIKKGSPNYNTHLRAGIVLLYAHWEGFIKNACENLLLYVKGQKLKYNELSENFIAVCLKERISIFEQSNKSTIHCQLVSFLMNNLHERASVPSANIIKTGSNLSASILREILTTVGIDFSVYELKQNQIDSVLLKNRNSIAHGDYAVLEEVDYHELHSDILWIMSDIKDRLCNIVVQESYRNKVTGPTAVSAPNPSAVGAVAFIDSGAASIQ